MKIFAIIVIVTLSGVGICSAQFTAPAQTKAASKISLHPPAPGSVFRIKHWWTRGDGPPIGPHLATDSVIERGDYFMGKHNILFYMLKNANGEFRQMICYEPNGDLAEYRGNKNNPDYPDGWEPIPLASRKTVAFVTEDSTYGSIHHVVVDTLSFLEAKDTTIESHLWHAIKIRHIVSLEGHTYNNEVDWYDAETGWLIHMEFPPRIAYRRDLPTNGEEVHVYDGKVIP